MYPGALVYLYNKSIILLQYKWGHCSAFLFRARLIFNFIMFTSGSKVAAMEIL